MSNSAASRRARSAAASNPGSAAASIAGSAAGSNSGSSASSDADGPWIGLPAGVSRPQTQAVRTFLRDARTELQRSYLYYMHFHNDQLPLWYTLQEQFPDLVTQLIAASPVPRAQAMAPVEAPENVNRPPYHDLPSREVESDVARQLNVQLRAGTHPTTQALVPLGLRFVKILGAGSQGTAVLFEMDDANGETRKIVAKYENKDQGAGGAGAGGAGSGGEGSAGTSSGGSGSGGAVPGGAGSGGAGSGGAGSGSAGSGGAVSEGEVAGGSSPGGSGSGGSGSGSSGSEDDDDSLAQEKKWMNMVIGARHMIQRQYIPGFDEDDADRRMYLMEFMKNGTVDKLLRKLSTSPVTMQLKSSDLWRVFLCLFRACIAMAYPNRWVESLDAVKAGAAVQLREELVPTDDAGVFVPPGDDVLVNTDINYNNIMIGDYDDDAEVFAHTQAPIFKVGDLGIAAQFTNNERYKFVRAVYARITGNPGTHTPEQFSQSWDVFTDWETMMAQDDTAGRYGWGTNLYQIGVIMKSLITQNAFDRPPSGTTETITGLLDNDFDVLTYGGQVLDAAFDHYDRGLRMAVAWIMAHSPGKRPTMMQLQDVLVTGVNKVITEDGRMSIGELVGSPPPPINPTPRPRRRPRTPTSYDMVIRGPKRPRFDSP